MELLFVTIISASIGTLIRYFVPGRGTYGVLLTPAVAAAVTAVVWVGLLWLGWTFDGTWIWVVSLIAGGVAALWMAYSLPKQRTRSDTRLFLQLSGSKA